MQAYRTVLAAIEPLPTSNWDDVAFEAASSAGLNPTKDRRQPFIPIERRSTQRFDFADGVVLSRLRIGYGRWALAATSKRIYFDTGNGEPDRRPEHEITGGRRPAGSNAASALSNELRVLDALKNVLEPTAQFVGVELVPFDPVTVSVSAASVDPSGTFNTVYRNHGFDAVPDDWIISVCPVDGVLEEIAGSFAQRLERAARQRSASPFVQVVSAEQIEKGIRSVRTEGRAAIDARTILFLLPRKDASPSTDVQLLFRALDLLGVRYRRAYATDPFEFSIPDQLPSILQASGGRPHSVTVQGQGRPMWSVGVDLSHKFGAARSTLAVSLVDPSGSLVGTWLRSQERDETARVATLRPLLGACASRLQEKDASDPPVVVLRDGRLFEGETAALYQQAFRGVVSVFEYRKRGNPQVAACDPDPRPIRAPYAAVVPGTQTMFVAPSPAKSASVLPAVAKVTWQPGWNQVDLNESDLGQVLVALTLAPGLGMHRRSLPAPIYWADGIAGADDTDLRFRGNAQRVLS